MNSMSKGMNVESERMMLLLQELAVLKKERLNGPAGKKRRKEIGEEMKRLAAQKMQSPSAESIGK
jgi:hypothetical protein